MAPLNKLTPLISVWVGDKDVTPWLAALSVTEPAWNYATPYSRTGTMELRQTVRLFGESFDLETNPTRWGPRRQPVKIYIQGILKLTLRIRKYRMDEEAPGEPVMQVELADLLSIDDPAAPPSSYGSTEDMGAWQAVESIFLDAGVTPPTEFTTSRSYDLSPVKLAGPRWDHAAKLCGLDRYALCLGPDESPQVVKFPTAAEVGGLTPLWSLPRSQVDVFQDMDVESPPDRVIVSGTASRFRRVVSSDRDFDFTSSSVGPIPLDPAGSGEGQAFDGVVETVRKFKAGETEGTEVRQAAGSLFPNDPLYTGSTTLVLTDSAVTSRTYDAKGQLTEVYTTRSGALGAAYPDEFPSDTTVEELERTIESWYIDPFNDWVENHSITKLRRLPWVLGDVWGMASSWTVTESMAETWFKSANVVGGKTSVYGHSVNRSARRELQEAEDGKYKFGPLQSDGGDFEWVDTPPSPNTQPPDKELVDEPFSGDAEVPWIDTLPYPKEMNMTEELCSGSSDAGDLAAMVLDQAWARDSGKFVTMPLRASYWSDDPFQRVVIDGVDYIQEGRSLSWVAAVDGSQASEIIFYGLKVGASE